MRPGSIAWLIDEYGESDWYDRLSAKTTEEVDLALGLVRDALGNMPVAAVRRKHVRKFHNGLLRKASRSKANKTVKWLRRLLRYAIELDVRENNPADAMDLQANPGRRIRWTVDEIAAVRDAAMAIGHRPLAMAIHLGYDTAQRLGDILALRWDQYDGEGLTFVQAKTGKEVWMPLSTESRAMLADTPRTAVQVIVSERTGRPFASNVAFDRAFRRALAVSGARPELQFRDLRRTAASEILSGGSRAEPVTGHQPGSNVLKIYEVPDRDAARAAQAVRRNRERKSKI